MSLFASERSHGKTEHLTHSQRMYRRVRIATFAATALTSLTCHTADQLEARNVPVKDRLADWAHAKFDRTTETEKAIETALEKALGKRVTVRCAKIDTTQNANQKPEDLQGFRYDGLLDSDALRLAPEMCKDLTELKDMPELPDNATFERISHRLKGVTSLGHNALNKNADPDTHLCHTIQRTFNVAEGLGASEYVAYKFAEHIAEPYQKDEGRIDGCYENGPLDMDLDESVFIPLDPPQSK